ncbi:hypothetical protein [Coleofasciculus chthonoplastes]|uniref:hypothetical protein n=1 Tax=Coleofasciculus chthonoplastes TaxID=64178 RepID=UPI0032FE66C7
MKIIQILPKQPFFSGGGVSGYALTLAEQLRKEHTILTTFLSYSELDCHNNIPEEIAEDDFCCFQVNRQDPEHFYSLLLALLEEGAKAIILHYIPGYYYLLKPLQEIKKQYKSKLLIMFHEGISPKGIKGNIKDAVRSILTSKDDKMRGAAREFAKIADTVLTSNAAYQSVLKRWVDAPICISISSNIGEPQYIPPLEERNRRMIVFGAAPTRKRVYQKSLDQLLTSCHNLGVEEIYDIGSGEINLPEFKEIKLHKIGEQPSEIISELMLNSWAGFIDYYPPYLSKSSIWAAYCSHGLIPVCSNGSYSGSDGLEVNKNYCVPNDRMKNLNFIELQSIAQAAYKWYNNHSLEKNTSIIASLLID